MSGKKILKFIKMIKKQTIGNKFTFNSLHDQRLESIIGKKDIEILKEELELIEGVYPSFNIKNYLNGDLQPVFLAQH